MSLNMDDDLDMSMRAPYISMSEASELPMLIAEDLMWGAQPDLKQTLNVNKKLEMNLNNQSEIVDNKTTQQKSTMESSLASLLCSQLLQHQQQINENQKQQQIPLNTDTKIKILDNLTNSFANQNQETRMGWCRRKFPLKLNINDEFIDFLANETVEWTMNDLLQLKKQPGTPKVNHEEENASVQAESHRQITESIVKCKEKSSNKRPSIAYEISNSKRVKGQEAMKPQHLMASIQKNRSKLEVNNDTRWSPVATPKPQPASNSVLMNLLVSGCDVSAGYYTCLPRPKVAKA